MAEKESEGRDAVKQCSKAMALKQWETDAFIILLLPNMPAEDLGTNVVLRTSDRDSHGEEASGSLWLDTSTVRHISSISSISFIENPSISD